MKPTRSRDLAAEDVGVDSATLARGEVVAGQRCDRRARGRGDRAEQEPGQQQRPEATSEGAEEGRGAPEHDGARASDRLVRSTSIPNGSTKSPPISSVTELSSPISKLQMWSERCNWGATEPIVEVSALLSASTHAKRRSRGPAPAPPPRRRRARAAARRATASPSSSGARSRRRRRDRSAGSSACSCLHHPTTPGARSVAPQPLRYPPCSSCSRRRPELLRARAPAPKPWRPARSSRPGPCQSRQQWRMIPALPALRFWIQFRHWWAFGFLLRWGKSPGAPLRSKGRSMVGLRPKRCV